MLKRFLSAISVAALSLAIMSGCSPQQTPNGSTASTLSSGGADPSVYSMEGKVSIGYPVAEQAELQPVLEAFRKQYPKIEVVEVPFEGSTGGAFNEFLSKHASSGDMPDMMWCDWNDFAPEVASGLVMALNDLMKDDKEAEYVPSGMTDPYTYSGKLYALPCQLNAMGVTINLDLLDELNLDKPSYDWTIDEFTNVLRKFKEAGIKYPLSTSTFGWKIWIRCIPRRMKGIFIRRTTMKTRNLISPTNGCRR